MRSDLEKFRLLNDSNALNLTFCGSAQAFLRRFILITEILIFTSFGDRNFTNLSEMMDILRPNFRFLKGLNYSKLSLDVEEMMLFDVQKQSSNRQS